MSECRFLNFTVVGILWATSICKWKNFSFVEISQPLYLPILHLLFLLILWSNAVNLLRVSPASLTLYIHLFASLCVHWVSSSDQFFSLHILFFFVLSVAKYQLTTNLASFMSPLTSPISITFWSNYQIAFHFTCRYFNVFLKEIISSKIITIIIIN